MVAAVQACVNAHHVPDLCSRVVENRRGSSEYQQRVLAADIVRESKAIS